jgi:predicted MPP superfamily phosphohydrolase
MTNLITTWNFDLSKVSVENIKIEIPRLPTEFDQYKIIQLSDFHLGTLLNESHLNRIIDRTNSLKPDLVAITGDLVSSKPENYASILIKALSRLSAADGVLSVMGNHDHWTDAAVIREIYKESQIIELSNLTHSVQRNNSRIYIAGIDDYYLKKDNLKKVIVELPENSPVILLAHEPDFADISSQCGKFSLQISGHSHGGQIWLPVIGSIYLPRFGRKYPSGKYLINGMVLYTNRGLGTSWLKIRYNCPPEISVFSLQASNS